ncbi:MAG: hypothetical protein Q8L68_02150 [Methylococcales bacterium]|nr:hypothetical protein [Methylococcales bacterium]
MIADIYKVLTTDAASGGVLIPEALDREIADLAWRSSELYAYLTSFEIPWDTNTYYYNELTAYGNARAVSETTAHSAFGPTYNSGGSAKLYVPLKTTRADRQYTVELVNASTLYNQAEAIEESSNALVMELERLYIQGNTGLNALEYNGLSNLVTSSISASCVACSLTQLDRMYETVEQNGGVPGVFVLAIKDRQRIIRDLRIQGLENLQTFEKEGFAKKWQFEMYRGCPVLASHKMLTTLGTGSESEAFCLDSRYIRVPFNPVDKRFVLDTEVPVSSPAKAMYVWTKRCLVLKGASVGMHVRMKNILTTL